MLQKDLLAGSPSCQIQGYCRLVKREMLHAAPVCTWSIRLKFEGLRFIDAATTEPFHPWQEFRSSLQMKRPWSNVATISFAAIMKGCFVLATMARVELEVVQFLP